MTQAYTKRQLLIVWRLALKCHDFTAHKRFLSAEGDRV